MIGLGNGPGPGSGAGYGSSMAEDDKTLPMDEVEGEGAAKEAKRKRLAIALRYLTAEEKEEVIKFDVEMVVEDEIDLSNDLAMPVLMRNSYISAARSLNILRFDFALSPLITIRIHWNLGLM